MHALVDAVSDRGRDAAGVFALVALVATADAGGGAGASLGLALAVPARARDLPGLLASIGAGAVVLGAVGWVAGALASDQVSPAMAAGLGIAVGGGVGAVLWFLVVGETSDRGARETVAVEMGESRREPRPADLFAGNPDPIVFFAGPEPVVRAVNPAFEETFGTSGAALDEADLREALPAAAADGIVAAARAGESHETVVECETDAGPRRMWLRLAVTDDGDGATGYVLFTPAGDVPD